MRILRDAQFAIRHLTRSPGFALVVVLTLALGIGASTTIFSVVNGVVLRPLEYPDPEQLVRITSDLRGFGATDTGVGTAELIDYQSRTDLFTGVAGLLPVSANVTSGDVPERIDMMLVSWTYFSVLGVAPVHGRVFTRDDDTPGVANIGVVSDGFWRRRLNADPQAVGRTIVIDEDPILVVGVMPAGFRHPGRTVETAVDVWSPSGFRGTGSAAPSRRRYLAGCLARLRPGVTIEQAQARLVEYGAALRRQFPSEYPAEHGWTPSVVPLHDNAVGGVATPMFMLLSAVGLLLLVACVNVAHMVLARSAGRRQEMAIRQALGASGVRLTGQLLTESALLAAAGGALAIFVASWGLRSLIAMAPARVPRLEDVSLDFTAMSVAGLISLAVTILFGFVPAVQAPRVDAFVVLKEGGTGRGTSGRGGRTRDILVATEVAMATVLLIGGGLLVRSVVGLLNVPVGFTTSHLVTARLALPRPNDPARAAYLDPARRVAFYRETLRRISALPGVERAAISSQIPLGGFAAPLVVEIQGQQSRGPGGGPVMHSFQVSPSYFETMGVKILRGRPFTESDRAGADPVVIVSEAAARRFWRGQEPVGGRIRLAPDAPWMTVIGVAGDVLNRRLSEEPQPIMYRSLDQSSDLSLALLIRTGRDIPGLGESVAREVRAVDAGVPIFAIRTMRNVIEAALAQREFLMRVLVAFGLFATVLALVGIYGVMAYSVSQRTREIGIRMAIGARQADVSRMVMRRALMVTAAGVFAGIATSMGLSRLITSQLFGVQPSDPATITTVMVLMIAVTAAAAYLPARRAAHVDPVVALRQ
jgi:putative ABC transport system permease protein